MSMFFIRYQVIGHSKYCIRLCSYNDVVSREAMKYQNCFCNDSSCRYQKPGWDRLYNQRASHHPLRAEL